MRKSIILVLSVSSIFLSLSLFAWTPIELSFWEGLKNLPNCTTVNGVKIGLPYSSNYWGLDQTVNGLETGFFTETNGSNGLQLAFINIYTKNCKGMQLAGASISRKFKGFQMGVYNEASQSTAAQLGFANTARHDSSGYQVGVINNSADNTKGVQVGVINAAYGFKGVQVGVINTSFRENSNSLQLGLICYMKDGFLPIFPFFNFKVK
jgi:hypothetical protein